MEVLKIATAGSVDDGKSTLIGRLLFDTKSITTDRLEAVEVSSRRKGLNFTDLSLLTDGLIAEREQGITIDVAHIYFSTPQRKYIIADTPGHIEYTRNMITGASNATVSIVLIDARKGVIEQTRRHLFVSSLLRLQTVFVCINKMDLVNYSEQTFFEIREEVMQLAKKINCESELHFIPVAAKDGDNVVSHSANMPWYTGGTLLHYLEKIPVHKKDAMRAARFPVQLVIRPHTDEHHDFRGYAGKLNGGKLLTGQEVVIMPSGKKSIIKKIHHTGKEIQEALAGQSITIELEDDVDVSRGNMIAPASHPPQEVTGFHAMIAWMDEQQLVTGKTFLLQHGVNMVKAKVTSLNSLLNIESMDVVDGVQQFSLNDIGTVTLKTAKPVFIDSYKDHPGNGSFILIDMLTNNTVAVGLISSLANHI